MQMRLREFSNMNLARMQTSGRGEGGQKPENFVNVV